ncbi:hypothetical protein JCGZ_06839 [Jatropha curcas]|uniref:Uncharacterized protein n=1 Tax=Jatropha curcas TaxID=180498 RepID=A0A067KRW0_JATCU|nr:hypothetical protein JCGZ_06839 [Jatropha curcas]
MPDCKQSGRTEGHSEKFTESMPIWYLKRPKNYEDRRTDPGIFYGGMELPKKAFERKTHKPAGHGGSGRRTQRQRPPSNFEEKLIKSPEPSFEQLVEGTEFMVGMMQIGTEAEWSKKISEFEDFLGIGDEASKMVQEQKAKARILQSILAAEDAKEAERKALKMIELE